MSCVYVYNYIQPWEYSLYFISICIRFVFKLIVLYRHKYFCIKGGYYEFLRSFLMYNTFLSLESIVYRSHIFCIINDWSQYWLARWDCNTSVSYFSKESARSLRSLSPGLGLTTDKLGRLYQLSNTCKWRVAEAEYSETIAEDKASSILSLRFLEHH